MPYPNEHAARQKDPRSFTRFRRKIWGRGISVIYGVKPRGGVEVQSLRFDAKYWTAPDARFWLLAHGYKDRIEPATKHH